MNLVFITDAWRPIVGGGQKLYWEVLSRLAKQGWRIIVVTRALVNNQSASFFHSNLKVIRLGPVLPFFNPFGRFWFTIQSFIYCLRYNPDRFMATTWFPAITLQLIKLVKKTPIVLLAIGFGSRLLWLEDLITRKFKYDLIITDDWVFKSAKFIPNGVDLPRRQAGFPKYSDFTFLTIARNEPRKGIPILIQAFKLVKAQFPQVQLHLFGPGFKTISQEQLNQELNQSHCLIIPSLREGHPLILFEAWAHRLPVIATEIGSVSQFINQANGYLVPSGDVQALAEAMIKVLNNKKLSQLGAAGYQIVKNYTWDKTAKQYSQLLSSNSFPN